MDFVHKSVMEREVIDCLDVHGGATTYVDGTLGGGGHAQAILEASSPDGRLIGIDRDTDALAAAGERLKPWGARVTLVHGNYRDLGAALGAIGIEKVDGIVLDLGVSSFQLETGERGFSFMRDGPLDMRMDRSRGDTARDLVNGLAFEEMVRLFREYGEEREAKRIARAIERERAARPIETTGQLAGIIAGAVPARFQPRSIHPATRVFQALRIAVNDELEGLKDALASGMEALEGGGRMVVISFHSLEDRIVKKAFRDFATDCICPPRAPMCACGHRAVAKAVTRGALTPSEEELASNPRSRSAKLRAAMKL